MTESKSQHSYGVRDTSLDVFTKLKDYLQEKQIEVYNAIIEFPCSTRKEISVRTGISIENVSGRTNALVNLGLVCNGIKRECSVSHNTAYEVYAKSIIDWELLDSIKNEDATEKQKEPIHKYSKIITALIKNFEKHNAENIKRLIATDDINIKQMFALKKIVRRINEKYNNKEVTE